MPQHNHNTTRKEEATGIEPKASATRFYYETTPPHSHTYHNHTREAIPLIINSHSSPTSTNETNSNENETKNETI